MVVRGMNNDFELVLETCRTSTPPLPKTKTNSGSAMPCAALYCHFPKGREILRHSALLFIVLICLVAIVWSLYVLTR